MGGKLNDLPWKRQKWADNPININRMQGNCSATPGQRHISHVWMNGRPNIRPAPLCSCQYMNGEASKKSGQRQISHVGMCEHPNIRPMDKRPKNQASATFLMYGQASKQSGQCHLSHVWVNKHPGIRRVPPFSCMNGQTLQNQASVSFPMSEWASILPRNLYINYRYINNLKQS